MPGPKPKATNVFGKITVELIRLRSLCETAQQHQVLNQLEAVITKVMPLWSDQPPSLPHKRATPREREQHYRQVQQIEQQKRIDAGLPVVARPSQEVLDAWAKAGWKPE
jgi:hypothetical protein